DLVGQLGAVAGLAQIDRDRRGLDLVRGGKARGDVLQLRFGTGGQNQIVTVLGEAFGEIHADAHAGAGDERCLSFAFALASHGILLQSLAMARHSASSIWLAVMALDLSAPCAANFVSPVAAPHIRATMRSGSMARMAPLAPASAKK